MAKPLFMRITLRPETAGDEPFLRRLFAANRWEEAQAFPFDDAQRAAFLDQQFTLQRQHFHSQYMGAERSVVERKGEPIGRLYVLRGASMHLIVDIALLPEFAGKGIGGKLIDGLLAEAKALGREVALHVEARNPARRLYARKGFREVEQRPPYIFMAWRAPVS